MPICNLIDFPYCLVNTLWFGANFWQRPQKVAKLSDLWSGELACPELCAVANSGHRSSHRGCKLWKSHKNIARGTTDPGYRVYNLNYLFDYIEFVFILALVIVQNLTTRWCHQNWFQIWPTCNAIRIGSTCISCKFGHQMAPPALVPNLATRWRHLHWLQIWPPDGATCISSKFGHEMVPLALVPNLATRWSHLHQLSISPPGWVTCISCKIVASDGATCI